jgi:hypothetical protein
MVNACELGKGGKAGAGAKRNLTAIAPPPAAGPALKAESSGGSGAVAGASGRTSIGSGRPGMGGPGAAGAPTAAVKRPASAAGIPGRPPQSGGMGGPPKIARK